jgi:hypothetical protein
MEETMVSKGIPLQISDVFLQELNKVDKDGISLENLSSILEPFLYAMANCKNRILLDRISEKIFTPILENNTTNNEEEEEEEKPKKWIDGGKLPAKTVKEILKMQNEKYIFPNFNILIYA